MLQPEITSVGISSTVTLSIFVLHELFFFSWTRKQFHSKYLIVLFLLQICGSGGHSAYSEEIITLFINKAGCDGRPGSQLGEDLCGVCGGYNDCEDCSGKLNGGMISELEKKITIFKLILVSLILTHVYWPYIVHVCLFFVSQNLQNWDKYIHSLFVIFKVSNSKQYWIHFLLIVLA